MASNLLSSAGKRGGDGVGESALRHMPALMLACVRTWLWQGLATLLEVGKPEGSSSVQATQTGGTDPPGAGRGGIDAQPSAAWEERTGEGVQEDVLAVAMQLLHSLPLPLLPRQVKATRAPKGSELSNSGATRVLQEGEAREGTGSSTDSIALARDSSSGASRGDGSSKPGSGASSLSVSSWGVDGCPEWTAAIAFFCRIDRARAVTLLAIPASAVEASGRRKDGVRDSERREHREHVVEQRRSIRAAAMRMLLVRAGQLSCRDLSECRVFLCMERVEDHNYQSWLMLQLVSAVAACREEERLKFFVEVVHSVAANPKAVSNTGAFASYSDLEGYQQGLSWLPQCLFRIGLSLLFGASLTRQL